MRRFLLSFISIALFTLVLGTAPAKDGRLGEAEFMNDCAACHGADGRGRITALEAMKIVAPDLTQLTKENNGRFPFDRVYETIDGRNPEYARMGRKMPVWGKQYVHQAASYYDTDTELYETEFYVQARIFMLAHHLNSIQAQ